MSRIRIEIPGPFQFSIQIPIRITDLNYGGHVGNDTVLTLIHEARMSFLHHHDYTEMDLGGVSLIMSDAGLEFKSEIFYGDVVTAYVLAGDFSRAGFSFYYKLVKGSPEFVVAIAKTGMVCYDYGLKKIVRLPETVQQKLTS